jgi:2-methylcitrate dehydratase PrpD
LAYVDIPKGDPKNPPTDRELENKFCSMASSVLSKLQIGRLIKLIWNLEKIEDIRKLFRIF